MSKIADTKLRTSITNMLTNRKERKFVETVDLQIGLKDYDPNKDKRFAGSVKLPHIPRPRLKFCVIADAALSEKCKTLGYEYVDAEFLKNKISEKDKKGRDLKKWASKYKILFVSESLVRNLPKIGGPFFTRWGKFPTVVDPSDDITAKVNEGLSTIKFQLKKVTNLGTAIGHVQMSEEQVRQNFLLSVNYLASLLKKGWNNLNSLTIRSTMGKPVKVY